MDFDNIISQLTEIKKNGSIKEMRNYLSNNGVNISNIGSTNLGLCYNAYNMEIRSRELLPLTFIKSLRQLGIIGYGQEYSVGEPYNFENSFIVKIVDFVDSSD